MLGLASVLLGACGGQGGPTREFVKGDELAFYNFSEPGTFEEGQYGGVRGGVSMQVIDGVYRIRLTQGDGELWWGQWGETYDNVIIDVDVEQLSERNENAYGVMCRVRGSVISPEERAAIDPQVALLTTQVAATDLEGGGSSAVSLLEPTEEATSEATEAALSEAAEEATSEATETAASEATEEATSEATEAPVSEPTREATVEPTLPPITQITEPNYGEGDGYLFLIQGSGSYAIMRSRGGDVRPLVDWTPSSTIHIGPDSNRLRAVCIDDYLAFYVNGEFMAEVTDDEYTSGQIGLVASASNRLGIRVEFDNLQVSEASLK